MHIRHAIIPAAGLGTRFLPCTKAVPKEMLPLLNKPAIEYIMEEGLASGISDFYMITSDDKPALVKYFQDMPALNALLEQKGCESLLSGLNRIMAQARIHYITQDIPLGLGHAVLMAHKEIGNVPVGVFLPDDIILHTRAALAQLIEVAHTYKASVIAVQEVPADQVSNYGIVAIKQEIASGIVELSGLVEKPTMHTAPSSLAIIGRYVLSGAIFTSLEVTERGAGNEIQLTDGINHMLFSGERVLACVIKGVRYDIGNPLGWLSANIDLGLQIPEYAAVIRAKVEAHDRR